MNAMDGSVYHMPTQQALPDLRNETIDIETFGHPQFFHREHPTVKTPSLQSLRITSPATSTW